jgi:23S rRNA pseudouridine1911/1915/1917 synthase
MSADQLSEQPIEVVVDAAAVGLRLDAFLADKFARYSRMQLRRAINTDCVLVNGRHSKAAHRLREGERLSVALPPVPREGPRGEAIPLDVLYEDDCLIVINKPPGMVVHPGKGHLYGTLVAALTHRFTQLSSVGGPARPGIVHRLDRDTSGVIVVARTDRAHLVLAGQFQERVVEKEYYAIVAGNPDHDRDLIDQPIGIHPYQRDKMAIRAGHSTTRDARTFYEVERRFVGFAAIRVLPRTGRTHQIRLHLAHVGCPILCDKLYGGRSQITLGEVRDGREDGQVLLARQALHARRLKILHPGTNQPLEFAAPLPPDLTRVVAALEQYRGGRYDRQRSTS